MKKAMGARWLILGALAAAACEGSVQTDRLIGTAAATLTPTVSALVLVDMGLSGGVANVAGRPPSFVVAWSIATIGGRLVTEVVPAHRLVAISQSLGKLWPPGPQAIAASTAVVVEGLIAGARLPVTASVITDGEFGARGISALMPIEVGNKRILKRALPAQSPQERTETTSALSRRA